MNHMPPPPPAIVRPAIPRAAHGTIAAFVTAASALNVQVADVSRRLRSRGGWGAHLGERERVNRYRSGPGGRKRKRR